MGTYCVYRHVAPNGKVYIGITSKAPNRRWRDGKGYWQNKHFSNAIKLYGWDNFTHEILYTDLTKEDACAKERELIAIHKSNSQEYGYNNSIGGENPAEGMHVSEETRRKHAEARLGKKMPPEYGKAISEAKKGKPNGLTGKVGKQCPLSGIVYQIDEATDKVVATYHGFSEMVRMTGYAKTPVREATCGVRKRAYGYKWKYTKRGI